MPTPTPDADARRAAIFAALGDETRLGVLERLVSGEAQSIARLTEGTGLTRQGLTKHLDVLAGAGLIRRVRAGRETLVALEPAPLAAAQGWLARISAEWDDALGRLKSFLEDKPH